MKAHEKIRETCQKAGDTLSGHGSAHFYTGVPPVSALCEAPVRCVRTQQTGDGAEGAFLLPFCPVLQGLRPLRRFAAIP